MKKFRFSEDSGLAGDVYYPTPQSGLAPREAGMFVYGFPSFVGPNEVTSAFLRIGLLAFQPHYFGTYDSAGIHSPITFLDTCRASQEAFDRGYVRQSKDGKPFPLPPSLTVCVGHSFGCLIALRSSKVLTGIKVLVLLGPALHYRKGFGLDENGLENLEYVRKSHPFTYRLASAQDWETVLTGKDALPENPSHPTLQKVIAIVGERDKYFDIPALRAGLPTLVRAYCGPKADASLIVVPKVGHPLVEMLGTGSSFSLSDLLLEHGIGRPGVE
jgi:pimeloyl-ACP methyl ester carboxylesterase